MEAGRRRDGVIEAQPGVTPPPVCPATRRGSTEQPDGLRTGGGVSRPPAGITGEETSLGHQATRGRAGRDTTMEDEARRPSRAAPRPSGATERATERVEERPRATARGRGTGPSRSPAPAGRKIQFKGAGLHHLPEATVGCFEVLQVGWRQSTCWNRQ